MLLLFDIDGTLLLRDIHEHPRRSTPRRGRRVWGVAEPDAVPVEASGRTDLEIMRTIAVGSGVAAAAVDAGLPEAARLSAEEYARLMPESLAAKRRPGVPELLEGLAERDDVILSLVTGNVEAIARLSSTPPASRRSSRPARGASGPTTRTARCCRRSRGPPRGDGCEAWPRERTLVIGDTRGTSPARAPTACAAWRSPAGPTRSRSSATPTWRCPTPPRSPALAALLSPGSDQSPS